MCWFLLVFPVFPELLMVVPAGLHVTVIFFCGVVVLFSSVATGFFFFNAFGRPYETLQGPLGLYLWTCVSGETCAGECVCVCVFWVWTASCSSHLCGFCRSVQLSGSGSVCGRGEAPPSV